MRACSACGETCYFFVRLHGKEYPLCGERGGDRRPRKACLKELLLKTHEAYRCPLCDGALRQYLGGEIEVGVCARCIERHKTLVADGDGQKTRWIGDKSVACMASDKIAGMIARCLSPTTQVFPSEKSGDLIGRTRGFTGYDHRVVNLVLCTDAQAQAAESLIEAIETEVRDAAERGFARGSSLLARLASGEIATTEFDERMANQGAVKK